jgi:hypothetical protein
MDSSSDSPPRLRRAWTDFLQRYSWDHVGTLTTDRIELSRDAFARRFLNQYTRVLARRAQRALHWCAVIEGDPTEDRRTHLHFVIGGTADLTIRHMEAAWSLGQSKILLFDDTRGGLAYLTKSLPADSDGLIISRRLHPLAARPPARHRRRVESAGGQNCQRGEKQR